MIDNFVTYFQNLHINFQIIISFSYFCSLLTKIDKTQRNDNRFFGSEFQVHQGNADSVV